MDRLLLVSNRLPITLMVGPEGIEVERSVGGVATGLREPHERSGGLWIGWPGALELDTEEVRAALKTRLEGLNLVPVYLSAEEVHQYYEGFCNSVLWPLFHYLTGQVPLRVEGWDEYYAANDRFAATVAEYYRAGDLIWVHDYQLMLAPALIRKRVPDARIGFFLHIPFPSSELFATLPYREELLQGVLGADLIGFHTASYQRHFASTVERLLGVSLDGNCLDYAGRRIQIGVFPMGIDAAGLAQRADQPDVAGQVADLNADSPGRLLVGIDRLDYTKGIPRRLLAYEDLLTRHPEWHGRVRLLQVAVPSRVGVRSYRSFRHEVDALVGRINGAFGTPQWVPVHYLYRSVPEPQLLAFYRAADVMLVTPVRDGMNLVAKEFVAVRDDEDGVLVLSEFAGAADELLQAVLVNPYDIKDTAEAYDRALTMSRPERRERMRALRAVVFEQDVHAWIAGFLQTLNPSPEGLSAGGGGHWPTVSDIGAPVLAPNALASWTRIIRRLGNSVPAVFLDYDGTLTPIVMDPQQARLSADMRQTLEKLAARLPVVLVSGRSREDLISRVAVDGIIYAGSHGFDISGPADLRHQVAEEYIPLLKEAAARLRSRAAQIAGALIEEKRFSVAAHYRMVAHTEVASLIAVVDDLVADEPRLTRRYGKKVIEVRPSVDWDKGHAVEWIRERITDPRDQPVVYLGDDLTDEDAFRSIGDSGITILIGHLARPTRAQFSLRNTNEVETFLDRLAQRFASRQTSGGAA